MGGEVGGNWRYERQRHVVGVPVAAHQPRGGDGYHYRARDLPDCRPLQIAKYRRLVDHFGFRDKITFRTEVVKIQPLVSTSSAGGLSSTGGTHRYAVTLRGRNEYGDPSEPEERYYEHVIVANGHHWDPRWPEPSFPGSEAFPGEQIHAHYYKTPDIFEGKRVLVLGIGNSACDIAVESSRVADETYLAMRRERILPKFIFRVPPTT
jgi:cation diffusion facilitator CzcD-associated flavoprotein CzcO